MSFLLPPETPHPWPYEEWRPFITSKDYRTSMEAVFKMEGYPPEEVERLRG